VGVRVQPIHATKQQISQMQVFLKIVFIEV
jgi:hypothetical protein